MDHALSPTPADAGHPKTTRTLDLVPNLGEMIKPAEMIDITGAGGLTLSARRLYNLLVANAFGPSMGLEGTEYAIPLADLRGTHNANDRIQDSIVALMRTVITVRMADGRMINSQLLGGNDYDKPGTRSVLRYSFDRRLVPLLRDSRVFAALELKVMGAFTSKYGLALYEALSRRVRLRRFMEEIPIDDMREMLGVPEGKLKGLGNLRKMAIIPAVEEVNALAPFSCKIEDIKRGRSVAAFRMSWWQKTPDEYRAAIAGINRPRAGRSARIRGSAETISPGADFLTP